MNPHPLSNLTIRSNLMAEPTYQSDIRQLSVFDLRDIGRRSSELTGMDRLAPEQQAEWRESLFFGEPPPLLDAKWANALALDLEPLVAAVELRPDRELAFELLALLRSEPSADPQRSAFDRRIVAVLRRAEFRFDEQMIADRVNAILGRPVQLLPTL